MPTPLRLFGDAFDADGADLGYHTVNDHIEIKPAEADIVRRIFRDYAAGRSMNAVVYELNRDAVAFPSKDTKRGPVRRGWAISSIHTILHTARYIGDWTWNKTRFLRDPDTGKRKAVARARDEWIPVERPDLRIIDAELWHAVRARLAEMVDESGPPRARRPPGGAHAVYSPYLLSGFLRCGVCGARMQGMSFTRKKRSGMSYTYFWYVCGFAKDKGPDVCKHRIWYRRDWPEAAIVDRFRHAMTPLVIATIVQTVNANITAWGQRRDQRATELKAELLSLECEAANLVRYLKQGNSSPTVGAELESTETAIRGLRLELANAQRTPISVPVVEPSWIKGEIDRLYDLLRKDPVRAKREMAKHLDGDPAITPLAGKPGEQRAEITGRVKPDSLLALNQEAAEFRLLSDHWLRGLDLNQRPLGYEPSTCATPPNDPQPKRSPTPPAEGPSHLYGGWRQYRNPSELPWRITCQHY